MARLTQLRRFRRDALAALWFVALSVVAPAAPPGPMNLPARAIEEATDIMGTTTPQAAGAIRDPRHIANGRPIPTLSYSDQPYIVRTDDGAWLCCVTTGAGREGQPGQTVATMRSEDRGASWSAPVYLEPFDGPEASYAVMLKADGGRIYCFYNHNTDNMRHVIGEDPPWRDGRCTRVDTLGYYVFRYSDDHGRSWSAKRHVIPVREFEIDRENPYGGVIRFFWNVGRPLTRDGVAWLTLHKVGFFGAGFLGRSEGALLRSDNLLSEPDPEKIRWETLPDGDIGLRAPAGGGPIAEEQCCVALSDGTLYCVYRTVDGHPAVALSRDGGHHWTAPRYLTYADGRPVRHSRAANFIWRCENGRFLYWFHNHGGRGYEDRNPAWLSGGVEIDTPDGRDIAWSQPEIALYDDDPFIRMSYPDLVEEAGRYYLTETQKNIARVHDLDAALIERLWRQFEDDTVSTAGLLLDLPAADAAMPASIAAPRLPLFVQRDARRADHGAEDLRAGVTLQVAARLASEAPGQILIDNRASDGRGFCLRTAADAALELLLCDGQTQCVWASDPGAAPAGRWIHVSVIVDGGPKLILFVVDGRLHDGGSARQFGWGRFNPNLREVNGGATLRLAPGAGTELKRLRLYGRALPVSEAIAAWGADRNTISAHAPRP